jgi:DNA replication and repair protein RecF
VSLSKLKDVTAENIESIAKDISCNNISYLQLTNFRNYKSYRANFYQHPIAFVGKNGIGKTNILESISLMQPGRGIRSVKLEDMSYKYSGNFGVYINLIKDNDNFEIGSSFDLSISKLRKVKVDGQYVSPLVLNEYLGIISLTPLMDKIFIEGATNRRKFFDRISWVFVSSHAKNTRLYEKSVKERNNLLKENSIDGLWFNNIEKQIVKYGTQIIIDRFKVLELLDEQINSSIINFPKASMLLTGEIENIFNQSSDLDSFKEIFLKTLYDKRKQDFYKGITSVGPHKTDLEVTYKEKDIIANICSTGEQKSLLISIIVAVAKSYKKYTNLSPILLLDEVFSHLDNDKRESLSKEIEKLKSQAFMTGIHESDFMTFSKDSCILNLDNPTIRRANEY